MHMILKILPTSHMHLILSIPMHVLYLNYRRNIPLASLLLQSRNPVHCPSYISIPTPTLPIMVMPSSFTTTLYHIIPKGLLIPNALRSSNKNLMNSVSTRNGVRHANPSSSWSIIVSRTIKASHLTPCNLYHESGCSSHILPCTNTS